MLLIHSYQSTFFYDLAKFFLKRIFSSQGFENKFKEKKQTRKFNLLC